LSLTEFIWIREIFMAHPGIARFYVSPNAKIQGMTPR